MPEAAWQDFAKMIQRPPPHNVIEQLSSTEPVAYAAISTRINALKNEQHEQDDMSLTPEQMAELKSSLTEIAKPVNEGLSALSLSFKQQEAKAEDDRKAMLEKLTGLEGKVEAVKSENESLKNELATLRKTPANNPGVPPTPDGELPLLDGFAEYQKATSYAQ